MTTCQTASSTGCRKKVHAWQGAPSLGMLHCTAPHVLLNSSIQQPPCSRIRLLPYVLIRHPLRVCSCTGWSRRRTLWVSVLPHPPRGRLKPPPLLEAARQGHKPGRPGLKPPRNSLEVQRPWPSIHSGCAGTRSACCTAGHGEQGAKRWAAALKERKVVNTTASTMGTARREFTHGIRHPAIFFCSLAHWLPVWSCFALPSPLAVPPPPAALLPLVCGGQLPARLQQFHHHCRGEPESQYTVAAAPPPTKGRTVIWAWVAAGVQAACRFLLGLQGRHQRTSCTLPWCCSMDPGTEPLPLEPASCV